MIAGLLSFQQVASVANALLWPLVAGAAVVFWVRRRAAVRARQVAARDHRVASKADV